MTTRKKKRTTRTPKGCNHKLDKYVWRGDVAVARFCATPQSDGVFGCGAVLSLGEASEPLLDVRVGELVQDLYQLGIDALAANPPGFTGSLVTPREYGGRSAHTMDVSTVSDEELAGFIARDWMFGSPEDGEDWPADLVDRIAATHPAIAAALKQREDDAELDAMEYEVTRAADPDPRDEDDLPELGGEPDVTHLLDGIDQADPTPPDEIDLPHPTAVADDMAGAARRLNAELAAGATDQPPGSWPPRAGCDPDAIDPLEPAQRGEGSEGAEP